MANVAEKDCLLRPFFEDTLGFKIQNASFSRGTLVYRMYSAEFSKVIVFEQKPDTSMSCTISGITRNIPTREVLRQALQHEPSNLEICRIVQQVILKMLDAQQDETRRSIGSDFEKFSRRHH